MKAASGSELPSHAAVLGSVSMIFWSLIFVISVKYAILILWADNRGEGGIVAMLALLGARHAPRRSWRAMLLVIGLIGAALLYGDGAITPAISVLSAIEGVKVDAPQLAPFVVPITIVILIGLFAVQRSGTGFIGRIFGPVMLLWFLALAVLGIKGILAAPQILAALNPFAAFQYILSKGLPQGLHVGFLMLGAAFLSVTGGEAMYADLGHFGRVPIRVAWFAVVLPTLALNYFGQGALLLTNPSAIDNPFYQLAPDWSHYPLVVFATLATIIASQAIISGAFSLTQQAMQLDFLPRMQVRHTASSSIGQIYMPTVNWLLAIATIAAVLAFQSSDALAGAYGIAVSLLMAMLEKRVGMQVLADDVFVNVAGGMTIDEPAADLGIVAAIASSFRNLPVDERSAVFGEVGLAGEVRATSQASVRVREAYAMGFKRCVIPHGNLTGLDYDDGIEVIGVRNVSDALEALF